MSDWICVISVFIISILSYFFGKSSGKCEGEEKIIDELLKADNIINSASDEFDKLHKQDM